MSRNTTSGDDVSSAASTSAPLRHSPATVNSGKLANSCRTPRRAAGSSSAINAFHLVCFIVQLWAQFTIRHTQRCDCTAFSTRCDFERGFVAVKRAQTFASVFDSMSWRYRCVWIDADPIVHDSDLQQIAGAFGSNEQET